MTPKPEAEERAAALVRNVGQPGVCRGCNAEIWWLIHRNNKRTPYDADGTNHFITCPKAKEFKR